MTRLERLRADHAPALLAFELENRAYFARTIPDRGDDYFREFDDRLAGLLAEQEEGVCHFHVLLSGEEVAARINLVDVEDDLAELGYRVGERWTGRGVATRAVGEVCRLARDTYGLRGLFAGTDTGNRASQTVLERNGFVTTGATERGGVRYELALI
ncbi:GNAT family N-acetyltransferase [Streptomyces acidiscabies]|uniref:GNAT family N-acetyltransferase n=1 Tax=Streptomyces acidiscabies TaxID=42234 RepID=A0AAP6B7R0_9ACTN|nr:GNAT family N-acetyltransferase [Streptomyces acidiscabies]MBP5939498.1 GNAT family N-acetyltransferase [Streptomyces sp. LBUM 1476]MBZ3910649.1 GNAT family N-acetyltransferase [Streptomyces acidiscabies]MDX2959649.1 GNAT family N-acetyltransferase [Streptomyces acidiscabies]MDX3019063.1 GNAT family N-acetyltransferase [Streptomyces acidiscabies]MDX3790856.1 GNAT family N-acetyltransferase [Streptomyces acidiscabies]